MMEAFLAGGLALVGGWIGSYLGAYLKKKGENLATHEDVDKLVAQMAAVTQATKEIESKISNQAWDRQKRWEIKRDAIFEMIRELGSMEVALGDFISVYKVSPVTTAITQARIEEHRKYQQAHLSFERAKALAILVCGEEIKQAFNNFGVLRAQLTNDAIHEHMEKVNRDLTAVIHAGLNLRDLLRHALLGEEKENNGLKLQSNQSLSSEA